MTFLGCLFFAALFLWAIRELYNEEPRQYLKDSRGVHSRGRRRLTLPRDVGGHRLRLGSLLDRGRCRPFSVRTENKERV